MALGLLRMTWMTFRAPEVRFRVRPWAVGCSARTQPWNLGWAGTVSQLGVPVPG